MVRNSILGTNCQETGIFSELMKNISRLPEENEGRVSKKVSQEFSRMEILILGVLSKLDEFRLNSQIRVQSGTAPRTSRYYVRENEEGTEDRYQNDPHPEMGSSINMSPHWAQTLTCYITVPVFLVTLL